MSNHGNYKMTMAPFCNSEADDLMNSSSLSIVNHNNVECSTSEHLQGDSQEANNMNQSCNEGEGVEEEEEEAPPIDIVITNFVCCFNVNCRLDLNHIARVGVNVHYKPGANMLTMKINCPFSTANIWSTGKINCVGTTNERAAKIAARRFARILQKLGYDVKICNYRVVNIKGICEMPFDIDIIPFCRSCPEAIYEPEMQPGVRYVMKDPKAALTIYPNGKVVGFAPSIVNLQIGIEHIFQLIFDFIKERE